MNMKNMAAMALSALLCLTVSGAWADDLYLVVDGTSATVMYGDKGGNPYYGTNEDGDYGWWVLEDPEDPENVMPYDGKYELTTVTIDASCQNYTGTTLERFFESWDALTTINNLENLNTSEVTNMVYMFSGVSIETLDLSGLNTASVTNMEHMFSGVSVKTLDLSSWNTSKVTNMLEMFFYSSKLSTIYVGAGWSTASVTDGTSMFDNCTSLPGYDSGKTSHEMAKLTTDGGYLTYKAPESAPTTYTVSLKEGTDDATSWQGKAGTGEYQALPLESVAAGTAVTVKYNGTKKVKSVKAIKK